VTIKAPLVRDVADVFQRDTRDAITQLAALPFASAVELSGVVLGAAPVSVAHGLGRTPRRWKIVDQNADARVWRSAAADDKYLPLTASAAVTVTLLVE